MRPLVSLSVLLVAALGCGAADDATTPQGIVLIVGDDHGYTDFGFMGSPVAVTPRLDRLASEGTVFTTGYSTASVCRPALRSLLTGLEPAQYSMRARAMSHGRPSLPSAGELVRGFGTLPRWLGEAGYASFQAGKFFEGGFADAGFDEGMVARGGREGRAAGERLARESLAPVRDFLDRHRDVPFVLWFAPLLPHIPHDPPASALRRNPGLAMRRDERLYFASITWFDDAVGELLDHLDAAGIASRTLVVYVVDNGWDATVPRDGDAYLLGGARGKRSLHELGLRTPIVLRWPGHVPAGVRRDEPVSLVDVVPTLLDYAGVAPPALLPGRSLRTLVEGGEPAGTPVIVAMEQVRGEPGAAALPGVSWRTPRWHAFGRGDALALFDVRLDPEETTDVSADHPRVLDQARADVRAWREDLEARERRHAAGAVAP